MARRRSASGSHSSAEMRWRGPEGGGAWARAPCSTPKLHWGKVLCELKLWDLVSHLSHCGNHVSMEQQIPVASRSHSESSHLPHGFFFPWSETLRSWRTCLHLSNRLLLWTKLVYLSRAMNTDIPRNVVSVNVRDEHLPLVCALRLFFKR